jgi:hypothetical protein
VTLVVLFEPAASHELNEAAETRKCLVSRFPYSILYWFDATTVHVSAIAHHRRRPGYWGERT